MVTIRVRDINNMHKLKKALHEYSKRKLRVGIFNPEDAYKAYVAEYGDFDNKPGPIVPRPFFRRAVEVLVKDSMFIDDLLTLEAKDAMQKIGDNIADMIKHQIDTASGWAEPLRQFTVAKKGHDRPLVDTQKMRDAIEAVVI